MKYLLDTNVIVSLLRNHGGPVALKLLSVGISQCCISSITLYELYCGAAWSRNPEVETARIASLASQISVLPFEESICEAARQKAMLRVSGELIEDFDIIIAASAITNNLVLVSANTRHMNRIQGLCLENWEVKA